MTVSANQILRVTARLQFKGVSAIQNVFHVKCLTNPTGNDFDVMTDLAAWLDGAYNEIVQDIPDDVNFIDVQGFNITANGTMPPVSWTTQTGGAGGSVGYAAGVAALVLFYTIVSKRIGRKFLPPFNESSWNDGILETSVVADVADFALAIMAGPTMTTAGGTFEYVVGHEPSSFIAPGRFVVNAIAAYQRRRRPGTGI